MEDVLKKIGDFFLNVGLDIVVAAAVLIIGLKLVDSLVNFLKRGRTYSKADPIFRSFTGSLVSFSLKAVVVVICASILGVPTASLIAVIGSAGLAIGLALQGSLSNFAGGMMLLLFKPFEIGDYIDTGSQSGTVSDISVFYTTLVTVDRCVVTVPNGAGSNAALTNYTRSPIRRLDISFCVDNMNSVSFIRSIMLDASGNDSRIHSDHAPVVIMTGQNEKYITCTLRLWCANNDYWDLNYSLTETVQNALFERGVRSHVERLAVEGEKK